MKYKTIIEFESNKDVKINQPKDVSEFLGRYTDISHDCLYVLLLDDQCNLQTLNILDADYFNLELTDRLTDLVNIEESKNIILAFWSYHKELTANKVDVEIVHKVLQEGNKVSTKILDHILISNIGYFSYAENCVGKLIKDKVIAYI